jgi:GTP-binding protein Era
MKFLGEKVYLRLWVKVKKEWRDTSSILKELGYK